MNRADFMKNLAELLADMTPAEREEAIQYYNDYFDDAGEENEQSVIASLGTPEQLARTIKAGLFDGGSAGEFTEKGFSGYEPQQSDEVLDLNQTVESDRGSAWQSGQFDDGGQQFNKENGYGYRPKNDGNTNTGYGNNGYGNNGYGNNSYGNSSYENSSYGNMGGNSGAEASGNSYPKQQKAEKKKMSGGMIVLIIILCIFAGPVLLGIGGGAFGIIVGLLGGLVGIFVSIGAVALVLLIVGICLFVFGITLLFSTPLGGLCMMGAAMVCLAVGLCFLWLTVMICGGLIPAVIRGVVKLVQSIFHIGGAAA